MDWSTLGKRFNDSHKKRLRNKGALIGAGIGAIAGGAGNYFRKDKDKRSAKDALIGAAGGAGVGGLAGGVGGHLRGSRDVSVVSEAMLKARSDLANASPYNYSASVDKYKDDVKDFNNKNKNIINRLKKTDKKTY